MYSIRTLGVVFGIGALAVVGAGPGTASAGATPHTLRLTAAPLGELQSSNHDITAGSDTHTMARRPDSMPAPASSTSRHTGQAATSPWPACTA